MDAQELIDNVVARAKEIRTDADAGNSTANAIITAYTLYAQFPEHCALGVLEGAYEKWLQGKEETDA